MVAQSNVLLAAGSVCRFARWIGASASVIVLFASSSFRAAAAIEIPAEFQNAPAVVLEDVGRLTLTSRATDFSVKARLLIRRWEGLDHADQTLEFDSTQWQLKRCEGRTRRADGSVVPVPQNLTRQRVLDKTPGWDNTVFQLTFPGAAVDSILEWECDFHASKPAEWTTWRLQRAIPVLRAEREVRVEKIAFVETSIDLVRSAPAAQWCASDFDGTNNQWAVSRIVCTDLAAAEHEPNPPPRADARLQIRPMIWFGDLPRSRIVADRVASEFRRRLLRFTTSKASVATWARELSAANPGAEDLPAILYDAVRARIKSRPGSWFTSLGTVEGEPTSVDDVLARGDAVGPDRTAVLLVMLQEAGLRVWPVLAIDRLGGHFDKNAANPADYERFLIAVDHGVGQRLYLDPECTFCQAGLVHYAFAGPGSGGIDLPLRSAFDFVEIHALRAELSSEVRRETVALRPDGRAQVLGTMAWQGCEDLRHRLMMEDLTEKAREEHVRALLPAHAEDVAITVGDVEAPETALKADYAYSMPEAALADDATIWVRLPYTFDRILDFPFAETRQIKLWWPYPRSAQIKIDFELPDGYVVREVPEPVGAEAVGIKFGARWTVQDGGRKLSWNAVLRVTTSMITPGDYVAARDLAWSVTRWLRQGVVATRTEVATEEARR